jgi:hypothetical protein
VPTYGPWTSQQEQALAPWKAAVADHEAKVKAYYEASLIVADCRHKENQAQNTLLDYLDKQAEDSPFTIADVAAGLAGSTLARTSRFRNVAAAWRQVAAKGMRLLGRTELAGMPYTRQSVINRITRAKAMANYNEQLATNTRLARALDKLSPRTKGFLNRNLDSGLKNVPGLGKAARFARPIPVAGTVITAGSVVTDIASGDNPAQAAAAGAGGMAAGGAVAGAIGGPPGIIIGAVVGTGVSYAIETWGDDLVDKVTDKVSDNAKDFVDGLKNFGRPRV